MPEKSRIDISRCSLCGTCKAPCPTYEEMPSEGMSARGRLKLIRGIEDGALRPSPLFNDRIYSCILCGACSKICPLGIDIPDAIYRTRSKIRGRDRRRWLLRLLLRFGIKRPELGFRLISLGRDFVLPFLVKRRVIPFLPEIPEAPFRTIGQVHKVQSRKGRVAIFTGCSVNYMQPHIGESMVNVLQHAGYEVVVPKDEVCCGAPLRALGMEKEAIELARENHRIFSRLKVEAVISACPTCTLTIRHEYGSLIGKSIEKAMDISVFLHDKLARTEPIGKSVTYHDPCHLLHGLGIRNEPRDIIGRAGLSLEEPSQQGCCGFGGSFSLYNRSMSEGMLARQAGNLCSTGADAIVTSCPGCMMQLSRAVTDRPVIHLIELIEEAYCLKTLYQEQLLAARH